MTLTSLTAREGRRCCCCCWNSWAALLCVIHNLLPRDERRCGWSRARHVRSDFLSSGIFAEPRKHLVSVQPYANMAHKTKLAGCWTRTRGSFSSLRLCGPASFYMEIQNHKILWDMQQGAMSASSTRPDVMMKVISSLHFSFAYLWSHCAGNFLLFPIHSGLYNFFFENYLCFGRWCWKAKQTENDNDDNQKSC